MATNLCSRTVPPKTLKRQPATQARDPRSPSSMLFCPGGGGWSLTKSLQPGARKPASNNGCRESPTASKYDFDAPLVNAVTNCSATAGCRFAVVAKQSVGRWTHPWPTPEAQSTQRQREDSHFPRLRRNLGTQDPLQTSSERHGVQQTPTPQEVEWI